MSNARLTCTLYFAIHKPNTEEIISSSILRKYLEIWQTDKGGNKFDALKRCCNSFKGYSELFRLYTVFPSKYLVCLRQPYLRGYFHFCLNFKTILNPIAGWVNNLWKLLEKSRHKNLVGKIYIFLHILVRFQIKFNLKWNLCRNLKS